MNEAKQIRSELKKKGWNSRQIGVRTHSYSMGCSIYVTVKDLNVPLSAVESIANGYQRVRYCEVSGEVLNGGNTYIHVSYDDNALKPLIEQAQEIMPKEKGQSVTIGEYKVVCLGDRDYRFDKPKDDYYATRNCYGKDSCARQLVIDWLSQGGKV